MEEAFYLDPHFWVAVSFAGFVLLAARPAGKAFGKVLDSRSTQIADELSQARNLRAEAQALLALYQQKQRESLKEAEAMLADTRADADRMAQKAEADLKTSLEKRMKLATDKIAQAETQALQDVQAHVVDIAIAAARTIIQEHLARGGNEELIKQAAVELERKLH